MEQIKPNKIHIIGSIGSGKTTLAKALSKQLNIPYHELDNVVWKRSDTGDVKRTEEERDSQLQSIINTQQWIIEGAHHKWVSSSFRHADLILFLDTNISIRRIRIIKRYVKQKLGMETSHYEPTLKIVRFLYKYNTTFEKKSKQEIFDMLAPHKEKLLIFKNSDEVDNYFDCN
ncbi:AAA family ATPase [Rossellomorea aquimaris]|uniref:AAA family ATPase n=1 Tax=Rossellomorea aquimaris TaxID=189382 RepID=UPI001CD65EE2|nr:AAA family ATPase [Rossellomorea aquimaris]MCA1054111.1 AAA family ATPase [Rossellomorea aquimaris]